MLYGITNHSKTLKHYLLLLICSLIASTAIAANNQAINVYLKLKPNNEVNELIKEFNQFLEKEKIFMTYQITPYIDNHPLHVTLFMAHYSQAQIPKIIREIAVLAKQQKPVSLLTSRFVPKGGYVKLSVTNDSQIQGLSNKTLMTLAPLRDKKALVPAWAARNIERRIIFNQYGSPAVLNYFNPHFSMFSISHLQKDDIARLHQELQQLIAKFAKNHQTQIRVSAVEIGIGIVNQQGQIVKELKSFTLE
ncbi:MAG: hypothetical protein QM652_04745 [Legionella sp.]|uniref:hypothetical protein n=1 Tax=Legionella sp. TaxID=459 RepID=UPI0039E452C8